jgi:hypothetical protein
MTPHSNIIKRIDSKLMNVAHDRFARAVLKLKPEAKPHSAFTVMGIMFATAMFTILSGIRFEHEYAQTILLTHIYKSLLALLSLGALAVAVYFWRVFFLLRREGKNSDKNIFFSESAGQNRKIVFYLALVPWFIRVIYDYLNPVIIEQEIKKIKYQFYSDYIREVGITSFDDIIFSILFVELMRILVPQTHKWTDKRHFAVVLALAFVMTAPKAIALNITRGHGSM